MILTTNKLSENVILLSVVCAGPWTWGLRDVNRNWLIIWRVVLERARYTLGQ